MDTAPDDAGPDQLRLAQLERIQLENEKLRFEVARLRKRIPWYQSLGQTVPVVTALLAIASFWWGVRQYEREQAMNRTAAEQQAAREKTASEHAFMQPWLESQRDAYAKALSAAARVANATDASNRQQATEEFWRLYHGEMIPVETKPVSGAMKAFGFCLDGTEVCDRNEMNRRARALGTAVANSMAGTANMTYEEFVANRFEYR